MIPHDNDPKLIFPWFCLLFSRRIEDDDDEMAGQVAFLCAASLGKIFDFIYYSNLDYMRQKGGEKHQEAQNFLIARRPRFADTKVNIDWIWSRRNKSDKEIGQQWSRARVKYFS